MSPDTEQWTGHPWGDTEEHSTDEGNLDSSWCLTCDATCTPARGCWCCNEPAYEWCLAEQKWLYADCLQAFGDLFDEAKWLTAEAHWWAAAMRGTVAAAMTESIAATHPGVVVTANQVAESWPFPWETDR